MKATYKNVAISFAFIAVVLVVLTAIDSANSVPANKSATSVRVTVVDLSDTPVHNAQVSVLGQTFNTDNYGCSPVIELANLENSYDKSIADWFTANVVVKKDGYVPAVVFNCVLYKGQNRKLTVIIYPADQSELPFVCYVESPPSSYVKQLVEANP